MRLVGWVFVVGLAACGGSAATSEDAPAQDAGAQQQVVSDGGYGSNVVVDAGPDTGLVVEADGATCFNYPLATGASGSTCEPLGADAPDLCGDACGAFKHAYRCTDGPPAGMNSVVGGPVNIYCGDAVACTRSAQHDNVCDSANEVDGGSVYAWACAPGSGAQPPHSCGGSSSADGLAIECCPYVTP